MLTVSFGSTWVEFETLTVVVSFVADYVKFHCQAATNFTRATNVEFATAPAIKFATCYLLGLIFPFIELLNFQF